MLNYKLYKKLNFLKMLIKLYRKKTQQIFLYTSECILNIVNIFDTLKTKLNYSDIINIVQPLIKWKCFLSNNKHC